MQLGVREVAKILAVSEKTVYRWIKQGVIPVYRVQDQYRIHRAELLEWVTTRKMRVSEEIFQEPEASGQPVSLVDALEAGGIFYRVEGRDRDSVLREVVNSMRLPDGVDREFLYQVILAREKLCSTAVGDGMAIPHPRSPLVLHVDRPAINLSFLEHRVEFGAIDNQPVRVLFTLVSPTVRGHLLLLSRLSFAIHDSRFKEVILLPGARDEILTEARRLDEMLNNKMPNGEKRAVVE
ncbi:PTS sugar transporter subunit IIA [bacterium]|nr:PTS sugar transporter subunit IIA [bacterium]